MLYYLGYISGEEHGTFYACIACVAFAWPSVGYEILRGVEKQKRNAEEQESDRVWCFSLYD